MKKSVGILIVSALIATGLSSAVYAKPAKARCKAVFATTMHCEKCAKKVQNTVAFEKGVIDLETNVPLKTVTITFDQSKTDTLKLGDAIRAVGYKARVVSLSNE